MKKVYSIAITVAVVGLLVSPAFAKGKKAKGVPTQTVPSDVYQQYDKNGNSILDADEKDAIRKEFESDPTKYPLSIYDTNNDKKLSDEEIAAIPSTKIVDAPAADKKDKKEKKGKKEKGKNKNK